ncbi:MAG: methionyl-tRNA formyltransferase [Betaproteobacteria bacterium]
MKIIFAGTPDFAASALKALAQAGHEIALVLTQPDRPSGRGMSVHPSPVKRLALELGTDVFQPATLKDPAAQARIAEAGAEVMVVAAYGLLLPQAVLDLPRQGCLNIHASLLPRWRGAAPIQRAIEAGDTETGVCIMQMEAGLDTGPVLARKAIPIAPDDTASSVHDRLADLGAGMIVEVLARLPLAAEAQDSAGVTYASKIVKSEAAVDWRRPAAIIDRMIRAFDPFPGAQATLSGVGVKVFRSAVAAGKGSPGEILGVDRGGVTVACGEGAVRLAELQKAGGKRLPVAQFIAGHPLDTGQRFELPTT